MEKIAVLLSTYNGERYLKEQIDSVLGQYGVDVTLVVRDDGSRDKTISILEEYEKDGKLILYKGENLGYIKSFITLIKITPTVEYYALCDQDDVWDEHKLFNAIKKIKNSPREALYCGNARLVDENLNFICNENKKPIVSLKSAMVKNFATGCTVVFNNKLRQRILPFENIYISSHDSWLCRVCLAIGGDVYFDDVPYISYRQHKDNCVGSNSSYMGVLRNRFKKLVKDNGHSRRKTADNLLKYYDDYLSDLDKQFLILVSNYHSNLRLKMKLLLMRNISCGNKNDDIQFKIAVLFNWV